MGLFLETRWIPFSLAYSLSGPLFNESSGSGTGYAELAYGPVAVAIRLLALAFKWRQSERPWKYTPDNHRGVRLPTRFVARMDEPLSANQGRKLRNRLSTGVLAGLSPVCVSDDASLSNSDRLEHYVDYYYQYAI